MKKILCSVICILIMLLTSAEIYIPQMTGNMGNPIVSDCIASQSETWYRWLCHPYWQPARTIDQPTGHPEWVSGQTNTTTQYQLADQTIWLVQHNTTAPANQWYRLAVWNTVVYSDYVDVQLHGGIVRQPRMRYLQVYNVILYTLVDPLDPYSDWCRFGVCYNTYEILEMYNIPENIVVLQTCTGTPVTGRRIILLR